MRKKREKKKKYTIESSHFLEAEERERKKLRIKLRKNLNLPLKEIEQRGKNCVEGSNRGIYFYSLPWSLNFSQERRE